MTFKGTMKPRIIPSSKIEEIVKNLCIEANYHLPPEILEALKASSAEETSESARHILKQCVENARVASENKYPLCQDTGSAVFFIEIGQNVLIKGRCLHEAITFGVKNGYEKGFLRKSIVSDPLFDRINTKDNTPPVIHTEIKPGDHLTIHFAPKGGGAENMSALKMFKPADGPEEIIRFVSKTVIESKGNPCPPVVVGVGIGGNFDRCALLAKKALMRSINKRHPDQRYSNLELQMKETINQNGHGPQGLGGRTTCLAVMIETAPCHIASLPVAVNINCHSARHKSVTL